MNHLTNINIDSCRIKTQWSVIQNVHEQVLDIWMKSLNFNRGTLDVLSGFPKAIFYDVDTLIEEATFTISNFIAKAAASEHQEEVSSFFKKAVESIHKVVSLLIIAKSWNYLNENLFNSLYRQARILAEQIEKFEGNLTSNSAVSVS